MLTSRVFFASFLAVFAVEASPLGYVKRQAVTALDSAQIDEFTPFTNFASTAYCNSTTTADWTCGSKLSLIVTYIILTEFEQKTVKQILTLSQSLQEETDQLSNSVNLTNGHFDSLLRHCSGYVGYSESQGSVIVAHQGTDPSKLSVLEISKLKSTAELDF